MNAVLLLARRAVREAFRTPEGFLPTIFISVFFLLVNAGSLADLFENQPFLKGNNYLSFQIPVSLLFTVTGPGGIGLGMVMDIDHGYFDKLRVAPIPRWAILVGRMGGAFVQGVLACTVVVLVGFVLGVRVETGLVGAALLVLACATFGVAFGGLGTIIALRTGSVQAVNSAGLIFFPLLFLTPNLVPREAMVGWLQTASSFNPVTYVVEGMRSLVIEGYDASSLLAMVAVTAVIFVLATWGGLRALAARTH